MCFSVIQRVAVCVAVLCSRLHVLQCVDMCCNVSQFAAVCVAMLVAVTSSVFQCVAVFCIVNQCVEACCSACCSVCCSVRQYAAACYSNLQ